MAAVQWVLSEHSQQFLNIRVTAYKTDGDSLAIPAPFSAVSVNMHNTGNTFGKTLPAGRLPTAT